MKKSLNANQLKIIAMTAMTIDHLASVLWPGYGRQWWLLLIHVIGRLAAPIFWYFIAEGYHYTHDKRKYASRLLLFALVSHFAYNFCFGIPFVPFKTTVFNQTSVIWSLLWGLIALMVMDKETWKDWQKTIVLLIICAVSFCSDWSCIAVMAIVHIGQHRGDFRKQMTGMMLWVAMYAAVYAIFIDPVYGVMQMFTCLTIPLLAQYNGQKGTWKGMKWFFYIYYPLHLVICGIIRVALHGNIAVIVGG